MASGYYNQDNDDNRSYQKTVAMCVAAASLVILLFLVILYVNSDTGSSKPAQTAVTEEKKDEDEFLKDSHNITSDELEFWEEANKPKPKASEREEEEGELTPYKGPGADKDEDGDKSGNTDRPSATEKQNRDAREEGEGSLNKDPGSDEKYENGDYIAITDDKGNKKYYEILKDVAKNDYDLATNLVNDGGNLTYKDGKREAIKGVDLSKYNGNVDFAKLKDSGMGFVMLRLGSRGYGTGKITLDEKFVEYAQNAQLAGLQIGAYFYSQAVNEEEAREEVQMILDLIEPYDITYPVVIDVESAESDTARTANLSTDEYEIVVKIFCDAVKTAGYTPMVYGNVKSFTLLMDAVDVDDYDIWIAYYGTPLYYPYHFNIWQFTSTGSVDGIDGNVDLNIAINGY